MTVGIIVVHHSSSLTHTHTHTHTHNADRLGAPPSTLDEFRNNTKNRPWDIRDISGDIVEFCQVRLRVCLSA